MNKLIAFSALFAAGVAFGETSNGGTVEGGNTFGVLRINTSAAETIVAVPWVQASGATGGTTIPVTDIVMTANLNAGDELCYYNGSTYDSWRLNSSKQWEKSATQDDRTLSRGGAILLKRTGTPAGSIFLFGQVSNSANPQTTITANAWNLLAPPAAGQTDLNSSDAVTWANVNTWNANTQTGDQIIIVGKEGLTYVYNGSAWGRYVYDSSNRSWSFNTDDAKVTAGAGFWYHAANGNSPTVTWKNAPSL